MSARDIPLHIADLCKSFGKIQAVDHLSLDIQPGEIVGFLGPNGAGKTTTLYMVLGLVLPSAGRIEIFGHNLSRDFRGAMRDVGSMVEAPTFYGYLSGRKNLELTARLRGTATRTQIDEILHRIGLYERAQHKVGTYSHGMKQRLGFGMALLGRPRLLVLDEPTNGMDPEATREILTFLQDRVRSHGLAVFVSSHLLYEVEEYCDRVVVINHGHLVASGQVRDILRPHDRVVRVTFAGVIPDSEDLAQEGGIERVESVSSDSLEVTLSTGDASRLNGLLLGKGYKVAAIAPKQQTLKEFFLGITRDRDNA